MLAWVGCLQQRTEQEVRFHGSVWACLPQVRGAHSQAVPTVPSAGCLGYCTSILSYEAAELGTVGRFSLPGR